MDTRMRTTGLVALLVLLGCGGGGGDGEATDAGQAPRDAGQDAGDRDAGTDAGDRDAGTDAGDPCGVLPRRIEEDTTVGPGCVRVNRTEVRDGSTLTVAPDTELLFAAAGYLNVSGTSALVAIGTEAEPIVLTSEAASPLAGDWQCVRIGDGAAASEIRHAVLEYGGAPCDATGADFEAMLDVHAGVRAIENVTFRHSSTHAVMVQREAALRGFRNNTFADNGQASILVSGAQLVSIGAPNTFEDANDRIEVDPTFHLQSNGTIRSQDVPYRVLGKLHVTGGAEVTVEAGTVVEMTGSTLEVFTANMIVAGTAEAPVTFTSAASSPVAGDWGCIWYTVPSGTPRVDHAIFEYAGSGAGCSGANYEAAVVVPGSGAMITNTTFRHVRGVGILSQGDCNTTQWCTNAFEDTEGPLVCHFDTPTSCP